MTEKYDALIQAKAAEHAVALESKERVVAKTNQSLEQLT